MSFIYPSPESCPLLIWLSASGLSVRELVLAASAPTPDPVELMAHEAQTLAVAFGADSPSMLPPAVERFIHRVAPGMIAGMATWYQRVREWPAS